MIAWPVELIRALARRRCVVFVGSGVSRNSENDDGRRPATWEIFLRDACKELGDPPNILKLIDQGEYLTACEIVKTKLTLPKFRSMVQKEYQQGKYKHATIHEHIYNLDSSIVASPNFDTIYETYALGVSHGSVIVKDHTQADVISYISGGEYRLVIKTHGSADSPGEIIFTHHDYAEARTRHRLFYELLKALALTHRFLFLGCGINDPDIRMLFEDIQFAYRYMPSHYLTLPDGEVDPEVLEVAKVSMKMDFLKYSPDHGHKELSESMGQLVNQVEQFRQELAKSEKW